MCRARDERSDIDIFRETCYQVRATAGTQRSAFHGFGVPQWDRGERVVTGVPEGAFYILAFDARQA